MNSRTSRILTSWSSRFRASVTRRAYSGHVSRTTSFSYSIPTGTDLRPEKLFNEIKSKEKVVANPAHHDAVVLLATPDFAASLDDEAFMSRFVSTMSASADVGQFHVLSAVVDHVAPLVGSHSPIRGFSVLRGHLDHLLPHLWDPSSSSSPPIYDVDADAVSALAFELGGGPSVTLPLARTSFVNGRSSTLLTSSFDLSAGSARLLRRSEKRSQQVAWPSPDHDLRVLADLGLFLPLLPLTPSRRVTDSFGNIIRGVEVDGKSVPASGELEAAVDVVLQHGLLSPKTRPGPIGVWAVVTPADGERAQELDDWLDSGPDPITAGADVEDIQQLTRATAIQLKQLYGFGGRIHKILSGGGGWGAKKGLLSLDPQQTHFAVSEEEEMARFIRTIEDSSFTPRGSRIQFFMSTPALPDVNRPLVPGISFGVAGDAACPTSPATAQGFVGGHFGALSDHAIFLSGPGSPNNESTKLSVHHSRVYVAGGDGNGDPGGLFWTLLPDSGTLGLFGMIKTLVP